MKNENIITITASVKSGSDTSELTRKFAINTEQSVINEALESMLETINDNLIKQAEISAETIAEARWKEERSNHRF